MSAPAQADRNLIFGLLALQMDFITREQLLDAMHAWMLHKDTPLGQLLRERGVLKGDSKMYISVAHDDTDVAQVLDAFADAIHTEAGK